VSERSGVEIEGRFKVNEQIDLSGQFSAVTSEGPTGLDEVRVPRNTGAISLSYQPDTFKGARLGVSLDYVGSQYDTDFSVFPAEQVKLDSYTLLGTSLEIPVSDNLAFTLRGENILNEEVVDVLGYTNTGAGVFLGVKVK
jgi:vitamin B12 transporter